MTKRILRLQCHFYNVGVGTFNTGFKLNNVTKYDHRLFYAINYGWGEVEVLTPGRDHGPVGTHQGQGQAAE